MLEVRQTAYNKQDCISKVSICSFRSGYQHCILACRDYGSIAGEVSTSADVLHGLLEV